MGYAKHMELTRKESIEQEKCYWCKKDGGEVVLDPYVQDVCNEEIEVRLHKECAGELAQEI